VAKLWVRQAREVWVLLSVHDCRFSSKFYGFKEFMTVGDIKNYRHRHFFGHV